MSDYLSAKNNSIKKGFNSTKFSDKKKILLEKS